MECRETEDLRVTGVSRENVVMMGLLDLRDYREYL
jgi:hypothetical protein